MSAVKIHISQLTDPSQKTVLQELIEKGMGSNEKALGLVVVEGVENYMEARKQLLLLGHKLANMADEDKKKMENSESFYTFGWSHGKEIFNGKQDYAKGSFYANPEYDRPTEDEELIKKYPFYCHPNIWPDQNLPELQAAFKRLSKIIIETGKLLAQACDEYVASKVEDYQKGFLYNLISTTKCSKARLLHYFPRRIVEKSYGIGTGEDDWCGWHLDHCALTGLTSAMFIDENGNPAHNPDKEAGLYVRNRGGDLVKVSIPEDCIAFQLGEWMQIASGGVLVATPHCVRAPLENQSLISRNTLAVFMQPNFSDMSVYPKSVNPESIQVKGWKTHQDFAEFTRVKLIEYHQ